MQLDGFQKRLRVAISREVELDLQFAMAAGELMLRNVVCWVAAKPCAGQPVGNGETGRRCRVSTGKSQGEPARIEALKILPKPISGKDLQQFLCVLNWMRLYMPSYNRVVQPLAELMEAVYKAGGGRTNQKAQKEKLCQVGWNCQHSACLEDCKQMLAGASRPREKCVCIFYASERYWGAVVTQVSMENREKQVEDQVHKPLVFLSGAFSGGTERWSIVEKEAYEIVETFGRWITYYTDQRDSTCLLTI